MGSALTYALLAGGVRMLCPLVALNLRWSRACVNVDGCMCVWLGIHFGARAVASVLEVLLIHVVRV